MTQLPDPALPPTQASPEEAIPGAKIDVGLVTDHLDGRWKDIRRQTRALCEDESMRGIPGLPRDEHRARVLTQVTALADRGFPLRGYPEYVGGSFNPGANLAGFDDLVLLDPSLQVKAGVQFGLFASAILNLGTRDHHMAWLPDALSLRLPGCFAMTEIGHGSNVAGVLTTATYDEGTEEFVIHTPVRAAWKDYLGNAALHGRAAVVFAQLYTKGEGHGVHAFFVPIREDDGEGGVRPCAGVTFEDDGHKGGLNGIDNGRIAFDHVRVPRTNLLNKYGHVSPDGTYSSPIASVGRRFFTMISTLVQGRVSISGSSVAASKAALAIAVTYGNQRRQFAGPETKREVVLMDYQRHQRRLLPLLARAYAAQFAQNDLLEQYHDVFSGAHDTEEDRLSLETEAAAAKVLNTWLALEVLQEAREACGGAGYMAENRLTSLRADLDVFVTFEGDNNVLLQLVGKRLITDYGKSLAKADVAGMVQWFMGQAADFALHATPIRRTGQSIRDTGVMARSVGHIREAQRELLAVRVSEMVEKVALDLRSAKDLPPDEAWAAFNRHQDMIVEAARSYAELRQWEAFTAHLSRVEDPGTKQVLTWLRDLMGLVTIEKNLGWYLAEGRLSNQRAEAARSYIYRLMARLRPHAQDLVDAFGFGEAQLRAPIASGLEAEQQAEAHAYTDSL